MNGIYHNRYQFGICNTDLNIIFSEYTKYINEFAIKLKFDYLFKIHSQKKVSFAKNK